ncbi:MAG: outer membrane beta-barrel protein [Bacteroidota bacterium]
MRKHNIWTIVFLIVSAFGFSQTVPVSGSIADKSGSMVGALIKVLTKDSTFVTGSSTDANGTYNINLGANTRYIFQMSFLGYKTISRVVDVKSDPVNISKTILEEDAKTLKEVVVETVQTRGEQKGDTTQFNSDAFKTHPDATAEDLIKKMPGITSDNNGLKVNGETVKKVLVDGKPFFGDDPNAAIKNLPADIVDKIQVYDKASDQAQFTGFNDGDQQKTINIITKNGKNVGQFGKVYAGYGTNDRYNAGATLNSFNNKRRISLLLLSNNINQQNFSISDIMGVMSNSGQSAGMGGGGSRDGGGQGGNSGGTGNFGPGNLLTGQQSGLTATQSTGLNYTDAWGKKVNVSGSYFFNYTDNTNLAGIVRTYFTDNKLVYKQNNTNKTNNQNHRLNFRFEYAIDSSNKLTIVPSLNLQKNSTSSILAGSNTILENILLSQTNTNSKTANLGYDFSNSILFQHKFHKRGRTISFNIGTQLTEKNNDGSYYSNNIYTDTSSVLDQQYTTYSNSKKVSANISYTEPLSANSQVMFSYNPSYTVGKVDKITDNFNAASDDYTDFSTALSNKYNNVNEIQKAGLSYKYRKGKLNYGIGADAQYSTLNGNEDFPVAFAINKSFTNVLPNAQLNYKFSQSRNLNINYRSATNIPNVTQLQNVLDISNPLLIKSGNADLKQTFENNLNVRLGGFNAVTSRNFFVFLNGNYTNNYISNATYILRSDSLIGGYTAKRGSQFNKPVNVNGYWTTRAFLVYGFPVKAIKSNLNLNGGLTYNHTPTIINDIANISNNYALNGGAFIGSNINPNIDFSLGYNGTYNIVKNTKQPQSDNNYFTHTTTFKANWIIKSRVVLNTELNHILYNGLSQSYNQNYFLWNAYVGYKFLKNKSLEAKISMFDILNQNRSISRTITGTYTEDSNTNVLKRYAMLTLTYTFKNFKNNSQAPTTDPSPFPKGFPPHQGMPPPPSGG